MNSDKDVEILSQQVFPFGYPRIKVCKRLHEAYRSLPRPSSIPMPRHSSCALCSLTILITSKSTSKPFGFKNEIVSTVIKLSKNNISLIFSFTFFLVEMGGIEPPASCLQSRRYSQLSYIPHF